MESSSPLQERASPGLRPAPASWRACSISSVTNCRLRDRPKLGSMYDAVQRFSRTRMVLPLRVWLEDLSAETPTHLAHTIDTSEIGCRLGGLRTELHPGQIITLQRGQQKAPFRVIWSRRLDPRESQAGLEAVDHSVNIWSANPQACPTESERISASPRATSSPTVSQTVA